MRGRGLGPLSEPETNGHVERLAGIDRFLADALLLDHFSFLRLQVKDALPRRCLSLGLLKHRQRQLGRVDAGRLGHAHRHHLDFALYAIPPHREFHSASYRSRNSSPRRQAQRTGEKNGLA